MADSDSEVELAFGALLWDDDGDCVDENVEMVETQLATLAVDTFLEEPSPTFHCTPYSGISDRDGIEPGQLSPMFKLIVAGDDVSVQEIQELESLSLRNTPVQQLRDKLDEFSSFFRASFRIQGITDPQESTAQKVDYNYSTGFALASKLLGSALHVQFGNVGQKMQAWRGMQIEATSAQFESDRLRRVHLKDSEIRLEKDDPEMTDPLTNSKYDIQKLCCVDAGAWEICESNAAFPLPKNPKLIHEFPVFLLPMSISMEVLYDESLQCNAPCSMVHFSMPEQIRKDLMSKLPSNMSDNNLHYCLKERIKFFTSNCHVIAKEMETVLRGKTLKQFFHEDKANASIQVKKWYGTLRERILAFTNHKKDGDLYIGTGRILAWNDGMIAHSISAFAGSSGAAIFLLGGTPGCYVGTHVSPASIPISANRIWHVVPDHNLACSTENQVFGRMYFERILPCIKLSNIDIRRDVLKRYLAYHLPIILRHCPCAGWTNVQQAWMTETVAYLANPPKRSKKCSLEARFEAAGKGETDCKADIHEGWKARCEVWLRSLIEAGPHCIEMLGAEETVEIWRAIVGVASPTNI